MSASNLHGLAAAGVSIWSDQISKAMLDSGELARRIDEDAVTGVTSNPTIFAGAIVGSSDYDDLLRELKSANVSTEEIAKTLMATDLKRACDELAGVFERTNGTDGFVSVEVAPTLAGETEASVAEARDWVKQVDRPNLLVKIPATQEGIPAIRQLLAEGISVNITLIFSLERYGEVMEAYLSGLEEFAASGGDVSKVASVASFFVSRVDTETDKRLEEIGTAEALDLRGITANANARVAYGRFLEEFGSDRYRALSEKGARVQKPLWASTSTKNPDYPDLLVRGESGGSGHREHHAAGDDRRLPGPWQPLTRSHSRRRTSSRPEPISTVWQMSASTTTTSSRCSKTKASTSSPRAGWSCSRTSRRHRQSGKILDISLRTSCFCHWSNVCSGYGICHLDDR